MPKSYKVAAAAAAAMLLFHTTAAFATEVGKLAEVRLNVYGVAPQAAQAVKRSGDPVAFQERLETLEDSGALVRFIDDSKLSLGEKSKVVIDAFVFDPENRKGNALIDISLGTLRFVTGDMPKGGVTIKTPTATLVLRGTDVLVHVHPDGTTDTTVYDGKVEALNNLTNQVTDLMPGDSAVLGQDGTTGAADGDAGDGVIQTREDGDFSPPEHRRADRPTPSQSDRAGATAGDGSDGGGDDSGDGCGCI